jgi:hypothetical protein
MAIFAVSFLPQLAAGKSAARDDKGEGDLAMEGGFRPKAFFIALAAATAFQITTTLSFVIPSEADLPAVS